MSNNIYVYHSMKKKIAIVTLLAAVTMMVSCQDEYDNYDAPSVVFAGQLVDEQGNNFSYDGNSGLFTFFQTGYGKTDVGTAMHVADDGSFRQLLFKGEDYKLTLENSEYPFDIVEFPKHVSGQGYDSISYHIDKNVEQKFTVRPYYSISNLKTEYDSERKRIVATFTVKRLNADAPVLKRAYIYLGTMVNVNSANKCQRFSTIRKTEDEQEVSIYIPVAYYRNRLYGMINNDRTYVFCRVALLVGNMNDHYLFSETQRIDGLTDLEETEK